MTEKNYMVAVDGSKSSQDAFMNAVELMNKEKDKLYILHAAFSTPPSFLSKIMKSMDTIKESIISHASEVVLEYGAMARELGVKHYTPMVLYGPHAGALITKATETHGIDFLLLGRRGKNPYKRILLGSTAKYCVEHCLCNVIVVRGHFPIEEHANKAKVVAAEEKERKRRIEEAEGSAAEREKEKIERDATLIGSVIEEEEERKRRIEAEKIIDERTHHVVIEDDYLS
jgi:nucleotide-binding universal stress UspA family protein